MFALVDNGTEFLQQMGRALTSIGADHELVSGVGLTSASELDRYCGVILTGGDLHVYEPDELTSLTAELGILEGLDVPILGICLGHQLIAHHFGGSIEPLPEPVDREEYIEIVRPDALLAGLPRRFRAWVAHDDTVVDLAAPLVRLARSAIGEFEAIRHASRPIFGLQFHPEVSGAAGLTILGNFAAICPRSATSS